MPAIRSGKRVSSSAEVRPPSPSANPPQPSTSAMASTSTQTPFFPSTLSVQAPRRPSHHKKRPPSHIPRPPNAFILFRANFIRDRHLHTTATGPLANVSPTALSTIVGITWRNLPEHERQVWVERARQAREEHKLLHPSYRYQPLPTPEERAVNRESKRKVKEENIPKPDLERCHEISRLLVEGHRGEELERRLSLFDREREATQKQGQPSTSQLPPLARSASLPTPPIRRYKGSRSRAYSTSDSVLLGEASSFLGEELVPATEHDASYPSSPEIHPGTSRGDSSLSRSSLYPVIMEHALPDLTYEAASPPNINLPEPQNVTYAPNASRSVSDRFTYPPLTPRGTNNLLTSPQSLSMPTSDPFSSSFSSLTSWDQEHTEQYYQLPYFTTYDNSPITHETLPSTTATTNSDLYAYSIPPFEFYHTLKSSEQSFGELLPAARECALAYHYDTT